MAPVKAMGRAGCSKGMLPTAHRIDFALCSFCGCNENSVVQCRPFQLSGFLLGPSPLLLLVKAPKGARFLLAVRDRVWKSAAQTLPKGHSDRWLYCLAS